MKLELRKMIVLATMVAASLGIVGEGFGQITLVTDPETATTTNTTLTIGKPSGLAIGNVMFANIMQNENDNLSLSNASRSGWTVIDGRLIGGGGNDDLWGTLLYKIADATDVAAASFAFTLDTDADDGIGGIVAFSGVDIATPFDVATGTFNLTNSDDLSATAISTSTANAAVVMFGMNGDDETYSLWSTTSPGALTELFDQTFNADLDMSVGAAWAIKATAGNTGTGTAEINDNDNQANGAILVALRPFSGTITTGTISGSPFCAGSSLTVPYTITGTYASGNIFTAQLSNSSGSFASPTAIGSVTSTSAGNISATIPSGQASGSGYRIRVISSAPPATGSNNGSDISIIALPGAPTGSASQIFCSSESPTIADLEATGSGILWYDMASGGAPLDNSTALMDGMHYYASQTVTGCEGISRFDVTVTINIAPTTTGVTICQGGSGSLSSSTICPPEPSTSSGPNNAGSGTNVDGPGTINWSNPGNITTTGNPYATTTIANNTDISEYLQGTIYGFNIPSDATIDGIEVFISRQSSSGGGGNSINDVDVRLIKAGVVVGSDYATATDWPTSFGVANYGGSSDLWGTTWTPAEINATDFGVAISVESQSNFGRTASVDYIQVTVTYTINGVINWYTVSTGGSSFGSGSPFNPAGVTGSGLPDTDTPGTYTFYAECSTIEGCRTATDFVITNTGTWLGGTTDWNTASNWCGGIPTAATDVIIPSGGNQPVIGAAGGLCRNITINGGASLTITGSNTLAVSGNWSNSGTFTANTSTVTFNGTTQTLGGSSSTTFNNLTIGSSTSTTLGVNTTVGGVLTVNAGSTLALSTFTLGSPSSLVLVDGATMGSSITGSGLLTLGGNVTVNDATTGTDDANISCPVALTNATTRTFTVADDGTSAVDLTITGIISTTGALTKAGLGTMVLSGTNTYTGATLISAGILNIQNPQGLGTTAGGATVSNGARLELEGGIAVGVETLSLAGEGGGSSGGALYNVSGTNSWGGAITLTADTRINSAAGTLTLSNTINLGGNILYLQGASTNANTASGIISGSGGSIQKVGTGTWLLSGANTFTGGVSLYAGTLRINHAQALGTIAGTFTIGGVGNDVTIDNTSGGAITTLNYPMSWNDDFTFTGSNALNLGSGAVTLQESRQVTVSASTLTVGGIINDATLDLTKAGAGTLSFGSNPVTLNNLSIGAGILISTSNTLSLAGNYSNGGTFTHNSGTVRFNGGALQTLGGANSTDFFNLTVDNSGVGLSLSLNQTVNGTLTLTDGLVATGANTLTIANDAPGAISGGSSGSYVNGNLVRSILGGVNTYTYPVGTATAYAPVTIAFGTGTIAGTLHGFTVDGDHPNIPHPTVPSVNRFWRFTINSGLTTANYGATFNWVLADVDPMFDFTTARCGKYSGGMWTLPTMGARMATSAEITGESGFSDFQIGTSAALPVTWLSFRATLNEDKDVDLLWSTASESNNEGFDIERSANARDWETIGFVPGAGTTSEVQTYQYIDPAYAFASAGAALIYYRLKQRDYDGSFEYSPVRTIELGNQNGIRVYPNPADEEVTISFAQPTEVRGTARLYTQNNRLAAEYTIPPQTTDYPVRVAGLPAGIYVLQVVVGNEVWSKRVVVE